MELVLSLFPGIGILDKGFELEGFCVVRGPDLIWGGDVRSFNPVDKVFDGVIGGSPCQDFSKLRRCAPSGDGVEMLSHFKRIVLESNPSWWMLENVPGVPDLIIPGFSHYRRDVKASDFGLSQRRLRYIQFGSRHEEVLQLSVTGPTIKNPHRCVTASDRRTPFETMCSRQGLPTGYSIPAFSKSAARKAVGNAVPLPVARALASAIKKRVPEGNVTLCRCGCARSVTGRKKYAGGACRKRAFDKRVSGRRVAWPAT